MLPLLAKCDVNKPFEIFLWILAEKSRINETTSIYLLYKGDGLKVKRSTMLNCSDSLGRGYSTSAKRGDSAVLLTTLITVLNGTVIVLMSWSLHKRQVWVNKLTTSTVSCLRNPLHFQNFFVENLLYFSWYFYCFI